MRVCRREVYREKLIWDFFFNYLGPGTKLVWVISKENNSNRFFLTQIISVRK